MGFNWLKATEPRRGGSLFFTTVPRNFWYSFYRPPKDEWLSRPCSHAMVLNTGPPDWESSTLTTKNIVKIVNFLINQCSHHMEASQVLAVRREEKPVFKLSQTSTMELFCENSLRLKTGYYFCKKVPS